MVARRTLLGAGTLAAALSLATGSAAHAAPIYPSPYKVTLYSDPATFPASSGRTRLAFTSVDGVPVLSWAQQRQFFTTEIMKSSIGQPNNPGTTTNLGQMNPSQIGVHTDASRIEFVIDRGPRNDVAEIVLVNGAPTDYFPASFPSGSSSTLAMVSVDLPAGSGSCTVELIGRNSLYEIRLLGQSFVNPYNRGMKTGVVNVLGLGDSWCDGTDQAPVNVGRLLRMDSRLCVKLDAKGGTGYVASSELGPNFATDSRLMPLSQNTADVALLFGSINDNLPWPKTAADWGAWDARLSAMVANGQKIIDRVKATNPSIKFFLTGSQKWYSGFYPLANEAAQILCARNKNCYYGDMTSVLNPGTGTGTPLTLTGAVVPAGVSIPPSWDSDPWHPSPQGARDVASWLADQLITVARKPLS